MQNLLIVGLGDVARRALPELLLNWDVTALTRTADDVPAHERLRVVSFDLDGIAWSEAQLAVLTHNYDAVLWTAPPSAAVTDEDATRMRRVAAHWMSAAGWRPNRLVYISTTGVYGDCAGAWVDERTPSHPESSRARARVWDERAWFDLGVATSAQVCVMRAPGIYALERLPLQSVLAAAPVMLPDEDSFSNHVHADDLAGAVVHGLTCSAQWYVDNPCILNVCDDEPILMGQWFAALAAALNMPAPKFTTRAQMQASVGAMRWSFMRESRKVSNTKLRDWGYALRYPSATRFVEQHQAIILQNALAMRSDIEASDVQK